MKTSTVEEQHVGVAVLVVNDRSEVLVGKRKNSYQSGLYGLPGGRLNVGEPLVGCARRELREETGLEGMDFIYLGVVRETQDGYDFIHFSYLCSHYRGVPRVMEQEKCDSWEWVLPHSIPGELLPAHQIMIECFVQNRAHSAPFLHDISRRAQ